MLYHWATKEHKWWQNINFGVNYSFKCVHPFSPSLPRCVSFHTSFIWYGTVSRQDLRPDVRQNHLMPESLFLYPESTTNFSLNFFLILPLTKCHIIALALLCQFFIPLGVSVERLEIHYQYVTFIFFPSLCFYWVLAYIKHDNLITLSHIKSKPNCISAPCEKRT